MGQPLFCPLPKLNHNNVYNQGPTSKQMGQPLFSSLPRLNPNNVYNQWSTSKQLGQPLFFQLPRLNHNNVYNQGPTSKQMGQPLFCPLPRLNHNNVYNQGPISKQMGQPLFYTTQIKPQQCLQPMTYLQTNGSAFNSLTTTSYENNNFIQMSLTELRPTPSSKGRPLLWPLHT